MSYPKALEDLIVEFMKYPGIGRKTAERYALHTIRAFDQEGLDRFASLLANVKHNVFHCSVCGHLTDIDPCSICSDSKRQPNTIMVVESPKDVFTIERSGKYRGLYHVLHGAISPLNGIGPEDLNLATLWTRVQEKRIEEVIIATSATQEGETTAMYLQRIMGNMDILITRIGYGVPVGSNLEYADDATLSKAIENRRKF